MKVFYFYKNIGKFFRNEFIFIMVVYKFGVKFLCINLIRLIWLKYSGK